MFEWIPVDRDYDILTPVSIPENPVYIALDTFCWITVFLMTFISTVMDTKLLLFAMRTQVEVQRSFQETVTRSTTQDLAYSGYSETLTRALNEMFNSYITTIFPDNVT